MFLAKGAGNFQVFGRSQGKGCPAERARNFPAEVVAGKLDFSSAGLLEDQFSFAGGFGEVHAVAVFGGLNENQPRAGMVGDVPIQKGARRTPVNAFELA